MRQKTELEITLQTVATGEARGSGMEGPKPDGENPSRKPGGRGPSMEAIVERDNLRKALAHVKRNKGAAGVDGMSLDALASHLKEHWPAVRTQLLEGTYKPQPVRRVEIPKASGGTRPLGIPTVLDRFIQQRYCRYCRQNGPDVLRAQLWLSAEALGTSGRGSAQELIASGHGIVVTSTWKSSSTGSTTTS